MRKSLANAATLSENAARLSVQLNAIAAEQNRNLDARRWRRCAPRGERGGLGDDRFDDEELPTSSASLTRIAANLDSTSRRG